MRSKESPLNKKFRAYGEEVLGKELMDQIAPERVDEARVFAMTELGELTKKYGKQERGTAKNLFCNYLRETERITQ